MNLFIFQTLFIKLCSPPKRAPVVKKQISSDAEVPSKPEQKQWTVHMPVPQNHQVRPAPGFFLLVWALHHFKYLMSYHDVPAYYSQDPYDSFLVSLLIGRRWLMQVEFYPASVSTLCTSSLKLEWIHIVYVYWSRWFIYCLWKKGSFIHPLKNYSGFWYWIPLNVSYYMTIFYSAATLECDGAGMRHHNTDMGQPVVVLSVY